MKRANVRFTYQDYLQLPEDKRYEILDGDLYVVAAPNMRHQRTSLNLAAALLEHVRQRDLGDVFEAPCDVVLADDNVLQPDIFFVRKERAIIIGDANLQGAPDLAIEILSTHTRAKDLEVKRKIYAKHGVQEYWIVDPDAATIEVLVLSETDYASAGVYGKAERFSSHLLPELNLDLSEIFSG